MHILVTGANGLVGRALCPALIASGHDVIAAVRSAHSLDPTIQFRKIANIGPETSWESALEGIDVVVHLAGRAHILQDEAANPLAVYRRINVEGSRRLVEQAIKAGIKRFVFLSSIKVNGESSRPYREKDVPAPNDPYGISKLEAEVTLREMVSAASMELVILRPPLVYGPGVKGNFLKLLRLCELGLPLPLSGIHNQRSLIGVDNLASAICCCLTHPKAAGEIFLVSDGEDISTAELIIKISEKMGKRIYMLPVPPVLLGFVLKLFGRMDLARRILSSLTLSNTHIHDTLHWRPPNSLDAGLSKTVHWYQEQERAE